MSLFEINTRQEGYQGSLRFDRRQKQRIYDYLRVSGGSTANELERALGMRMGSITARLKSGTLEKEKLEASNMSDCYTELKVLREKYGASNFDFAVKKLMRERLSIDPEKRKREKFPPRMYQALYNEQVGLCPYCNLHLDVPAIKNEIDHIDPNIEGTAFNSRRNLQLLHKRCNRTKGADNIYQQSKKGGKTFSEIIKPTEDA